jgi:hypothetical protein
MDCDWNMVRVLLAMLIVKYLTKVGQGNVGNKIFDQALYVDDENIKASQYLRLKSTRI